VRNTRYSGIGMYASKNTLVANNTIVNAASGAHSAIYFGVTFQDWDPKAKRPANINPRVVNNLIIQSNNRCVEIRYSNELGGLSGLSGSPGTDWNGYGNGCVFRDGRPTTSFSQGNLGQWRTALGADANSKQAAYSVDANGRLPAGSPAINAGTTLTQVTDDIDGDVRVAPYDIGADEVGGAPPPPPPPSRRRGNGAQPLLPPTTSAVAPQAAPARVAGSTTTPAGGGDAPAAVPARPPQRPAATAATVRITSPAYGLWARLRDWFGRDASPERASRD
jgi:hypothetical protein